MSQIVDCSEFCRLCLVKEQVNTPIFEEDGGYHQLSTKISTCLPVKVSREDSLPKRICDGCCYKVEQQYQFWNISLNAEKQFKQWLGISEDTETAKQNVNKIKKESTYDGPSASKRPKRNARRKAVQNIRQATAAQQSDSDSDIPLAARTVAPSIEVEPIAKDENDSDHHDFPEDNDSMDPPNFVNMNLEGEQDQAGPSGLQKAESTEPVEAAPATLNMEIEAGEGAVWICKQEPLYEEIEMKSEYGYSCTNNSEESGYVKIQDKFSCNMCNRSFGKKVRWKSHYAQHFEARPFRCDICDKSYKTKDGLYAHTKLHSKEKKYSCPTCGKLHYSTTAGKFCEKTHSNDFAHKCVECDKGYHSKYHLKKHIETKHRKMKSHVCDICHKNFSSASYLNVHSRSHDDKYVPPEFKCELCGKTYNIKSVYRRHVLSHEGFSCHICGKIFKYAKGLQQHIWIHKGERPFSCDVCGKSFNKKTILTVHLRTHTNEKRYKCDVCGKRFTQRSPLVIHMRSHTGERPYKCELCTEAFVSRTYLKTHEQKIHDLNFD